MNSVTPCADSEPRADLLAAPEVPGSGCRRETFALAAAVDRLAMPAQPERQQVAGASRPVAFRGNRRPATLFASGPSRRIGRPALATVRVSPRARPDKARTAHPGTQLWTNYRCKCGAW